MASKNTSKQKNKIKYYCRLCNSFICYVTYKYGSGLCRSCAFFGKRNPAYKTGKYQNNKHCEICNKKISKSAKRCNKCVIRTGRVKKKYYCIDCGKQRSAIQCKRCWKCYVKWSQNPRNNKMFGKKAKHGKRIKYKGTYYRSTWEANFAKFLDLSGIKYRYEPEVFDLGNTTYRPDFYIPEWDLWIEIKGWFKKDAKKKIKLFKLIVNKNLKILMKKDLENFGFYFNNFVRDYC